MSRLPQPGFSAPRRPASRPDAARAGARRLRAIALVAAVALLPASGRTQQADTLFADLGGHDGLSRIVDTSAQIWLDDDRIKATFEDSNMPRLRRLLFDQLCHITGGGCDYRGQDMAKAHRGLHLRTEQFNALAEDMQTAMDRLGIAFSTQNRLVALLAPMHRDVVTR